MYKPTTLKRTMSNIFPPVILSMCIHSGPSLTGFHIHKFNQAQSKIIWEKIPKNSKKQNLDLPSTGNSLHTIYNYLHSIHTVLGIISNLEMI